MMKHDVKRTVRIQCVVCQLLVRFLPLEKKLIIYDNICFCVRIFGVLASLVPIKSG